MKNDNNAMVLESVSFNHQLQSTARLLTPLECMRWEPAIDAIES